MSDSAPLEGAPDPLGRRLGLNREAVVQAGIRLADEHGLAAVSMSRVAESLGFKTMALYRHVANKEELLFLMHDVASQPPPEDPRPSGKGWRADLTAWCLEQQAVLRRHPWIVRLRLREWSGTPAEITWMNQGLRMLQAVWLERGLLTLDGTGLRERDKVEVLLMLYGLIAWEGLYRTQMAAPEAGEGTMGDALRRIDSRAFPGLHRAVEAGAFDEPAESYGTLEFGLERVFDGVERLADRRRHEDPGARRAGKRRQP
jgi:AcrR family transcriptional regulator